MLTSRTPSASFESSARVLGCALTGGLAMMGRRTSWAAGALVAGLALACSSNDHSDLFSSQPSGSGGASTSAGSTSSTTSGDTSGATSSATTGVGSTSATTGTTAASGAATTSATTTSA